MSGLSLARRRTQLQLLAEVCEYGRRARVAVVQGDHERRVFVTRFLALEQNGLLLEWPNASSGGSPPAGGAVEVFFLHKHQRFAFPARSLGRTWWECARRGRLAAWRLTVPLRVEQKQQREHYRISLADIDPIDIEFTCVTNPDTKFSARLSNLSAGGLGAVLDACEGNPCVEGALYWTQFTVPIPHEPLTFEFVVRVMHVQPVPNQETAVLGCMFCPGEDPTAYQSNIRQLEQFVMERQRAQLRRTRRYGLEGG